MQLVKQFGALRLVRKEDGSPALAIGGEECCCLGRFGCFRPTKWRIIESQGDIYAEGDVGGEDQSQLLNFPIPWKAYWYKTRNLSLKLEVLFEGEDWKELESWESTVALCQNADWFASHLLSGGWEQPEPYRCALWIGEVPEGEENAQWYISDRLQQQFDEKGGECPGCVRGLPGGGAQGPFASKDECETELCGEPKDDCLVPCTLTAVPQYTVKTDPKTRAWVFDGAIDGEWNNMKNWGHQNIYEWPDILPNEPFSSADGNTTYAINAPVTTLSGIVDRPLPEPPEVPAGGDEWSFVAGADVIVNEGGSIGIKLRHAGTAAGRFYIRGVVAATGQCPENCEPPGEGVENPCSVGQVTIAAGECNYLIFLGGGRLDGIAVSEGGVVQFKESSTTGGGAKLVGVYFLFSDTTTLEENCDTSQAENIYFIGASKNKSTIATGDGPPTVVRFWHNSRNDTSGTVPAGTAFYGGTPSADIGDGQSEGVPANYFCLDLDKGFGRKFSPTVIEIDGTGGNYGAVDGDALFYGDSHNYGRVEGDGTFDNFPNDQGVPRGATNKPAGAVEQNGIFHGISANEGMVNGNGTFDGESKNVGTVEGNGDFSDSAKNGDEDYFAGVVEGNGAFSDTAKNHGTVEHDATFSDFSENAYSGTVDNDATFEDDSTNSGTVNGDATFNERSLNALYVGGDATFNGESRHSRRVVGNATFNGTATAVQIGDLNVKVDGNVTFNESSSVAPATTLVVNGVATFDGSGTSNNGTLQMEDTDFQAAGEAIFLNGARNAGTVQGNSRFEDTSVNQGTLDGDATFGDNSRHEEGFVVTGDLTAGGEASISGIVEGDAIFGNDSRMEGVAVVEGDLEANNQAVITGVVNGSADFNDKSSMSGPFARIKENAYFSAESTVAGGKVDGNAGFSGDSKALYSERPLLVDGDVMFVNDSLQMGTLVAEGVVVFQGNSKNTGVVSGDASFEENSSNEGTVMGSAEFTGGASNEGTVTANAVFSGNATNDGIVEGNAEFNEDSRNDGTVLGSATLNNYSTSSGTLASATFTGVASNSGTVVTGIFEGNTENENGGSVTNGTFSSTALNRGDVENGTFNGDSVNGVGGSVTSAIFNNSSENAGYAATANFNTDSRNTGLVDTGTFDGDSRNSSSGSVTTAAFNDDARNEGVVTTGEFFDTSENASTGTVTNGTFRTISVNYGTVTTGVFFGTSKNEGTVVTGTFNESSENNLAVSGDGTFNDSSNNNGTVGGTKTCNTTGVC